MNGRRTTGIETVGSQSAQSVLSEQIDILLRQSGMFSPQAGKVVLSWRGYQNSFI